MSVLDLNPITGITKGIMEGLDGLFTSDEERLRAELEVQKLLQQPHILQAMTNIEEAKHRTVFVAGWRPALGWICAIGIGYQFILAPMLGAYVSMNPDEYEGVVIPVLESGELMTLVLSLLGLGGLRTAEKIKGVSK
jgi:hypothetical protein